jgi:hypothetical protein
VTRIRASAATHRGSHCAPEGREAVGFLAEAAEILEQLITASHDGFLAELKSDPGRPGLSTILDEIAKLERVAELELPADLFADCSEKLIAAWRARGVGRLPV